MNEDASTDSVAKQKEENTEKAFPAIPLRMILPVKLWNRLLATLLSVHNDF
jgi:hypothetical protein